MHLEIGVGGGGVQEGFQAVKRQETAGVKWKDNNSKDTKRATVQPARAGNLWTVEEEMEGGDSRVVGRINAPPGGRRNDFSGGTGNWSRFWESVAT